MNLVELGEHIRTLREALGKGFNMPGAYIEEWLLSQLGAQRYQGSAKCCDGHTTTGEIPVELKHFMSGWRDGAHDLGFLNYTILIGYSGRWGEKKKGENPTAYYLTDVRLRLPAPAREEELDRRHKSGGSSGVFNWKLFPRLPSLEGRVL